MLLERFGLWEVRDERVSTFSRGMQQRLGLCRVLLHEPTLLVLDEPFNALDDDGAALLDATLDDLQPRSAVIVATHDPRARRARSRPSGWRSHEQRYFARRRRARAQGPAARAAGEGDAAGDAALRDRGARRSSTSRCRAAPDAQAAIGLLWTAIVFTALLGLTRAFVAEREQGVFDALVLAPCDRSAIWLGKAIAVLAFLVAAEVVALPAFALFFSGVGWRTVAAVALADIGICAVGTLTGAMAVAGRARELLLPLLFLPLAIPIVVGGRRRERRAAARSTSVSSRSTTASSPCSPGRSFEYVVAES